MSATSLSLVLLIIFTNLSACSKKTELTHFTNISTYDKKAPGDLLNDPVIGSEFKKLVPAEQRVCLDDLFNYMPDLEIKQDGSLEAIMYGSGSENHIVAYLDLTPQGNLDLVMTCAEGSLSAKPYIYFTNRELKNPTIKLKDWLEAIQYEIASLTITNGKQSLQATVATFINRSKSDSALALSQQSVEVEQYDVEVEQAQKAQTDQVRRSSVYSDSFILNGDLGTIQQPATFDAYLIGGGNQVELNLKNNWLIVKNDTLEYKGRISKKSFPDYNCIGIHPDPVLGYDSGEYLICQMVDSAIIQSATWTAPNHQPTAVQMEKNEVFYIDGWKEDLNPSVYKIVLRNPQ